MGKMPEGCNGLMLTEGSTQFCKMTCKWSKKNSGRKKIDRNSEKHKKSRSNIKQPQSICLVMEKDHLEFIKSQALQKSIQEGKLIEPNQLIRDALQRAFPTPKQFDMFGDRR